MPTIYDVSGPDASDQGDPAASDPVVVEWDDKRDGRQRHVFADLDELRAEVATLARLN